MEKVKEVMEVMKGATKAEQIIVTTVYGFLTGVALGTEIYLPEVVVILGTLTLLLLIASIRD